MRQVAKHWYDHKLRTDSWHGHHVTEMGPRATTSRRLDTTKAGTLVGLWFDFSLNVAEGLMVKNIQQ